MSITDGISLFLGAISIVLAIYSVHQSKKYKDLGDKYNKYMETLIQKNNENFSYSAIITRDIIEKISANPYSINLHKDELYIFKNSNYQIHNASQVIGKLNQELPRVLDQTYIDSIMAKLSLDDGTTNEIGIVSLRHQYNKNDLEIIKELNDIFYEDGISFVIKIS